jgi:hypothetical protein
MRSSTLKILSHFEEKELRVKCTDDSIFVHTHDDLLQNDEDELIVQEDLH